jgi:hypothetical protein
MRARRTYDVFNVFCSVGNNVRTPLRIHIQVVPGGMCQTSGGCFIVKYTDLTQNTYVQSWTDTEIMAREVWNFDSCYTLVDYQIHIKTGRNMWVL